MQPSNLESFKAAIVALHETHFDRVVRYFAVRTVDLGEAEALANEVFVRALRAGSRRPNDLPLEARIFQLAYQVAEDHWQLQSWRAHVKAPITPIHSFGAKQTVPAESLTHANAGRQLAPLIRELDINKQEILALRFGAGFNAQQIAQVLEIDSSNVRELQRAALQELDTHLEMAANS